MDVVQVKGVDQSMPAYQALAYVMLLLCVGFGVAWVVCMTLGVLDTMHKRKAAKAAKALADLSKPRSPGSSEGSLEEGAGSASQGEGSAGEGGEEEEDGISLVRHPSDGVTPFPNPVAPRLGSTASSVSAMRLLGRGAHASVRGLTTAAAGTKGSTLPGQPVSAAFGSGPTPASAAPAATVPSASMVALQRRLGGNSPGSLDMMNPLHQGQGSGPSGLQSSSSSTSASTFPSSTAWGDDGPSRPGRHPPAPPPSTGAHPSSSLHSEQVRGLEVYMRPVGAPSGLIVGGGHGGEAGHGLLGPVRLDRAARIAAGKRMSIGMSKQAVREGEGEESPHVPDSS